MGVEDPRQRSDAERHAAISPLEADDAGTSRTMIVLRLAKLIDMALAEHGLTENQYRALGFIEEGKADLTEMGFRLVMKKPNVATLLDALVGRGLVAKRPRADDRRRLDLTVTERGRAVFRAASDAAELALTGLATYGDGDPHQRLEGISLWASTVEEAAARLRSARATPSERRRPRSPRRRNA